MDSGLEAGRPRAEAAKRRSAKPSGGAKRTAAKTARLQLHLGEGTVKRLAVHAALVGRNQSKVVDDILTSWLARFGQGRELFPPVPVDSADGVESH